MIRKYKWKKVHEPNQLVEDDNVIRGEFQTTTNQEMEVIVWHDDKEINLEALMILILFNQEYLDRKMEILVRKVIPLSYEKMKEMQEVEEGSFELHQA